MLSHIANYRPICRQYKRNFVKSLSFLAQRAEFLEQAASVAESAERSCSQRCERTAWKATAQVAQPSPGSVLARTLLPPQEQPIGIVTSSIGALFMVAMLLLVVAMLLRSGSRSTSTSQFRCNAICMLRRNITEKHNDHQKDCHRHRLDLGHWPGNSPCACS
jgi:hypothetical protein